MYQHAQLNFKKLIKKGCYSTIIIPYGFNKHLKNRLRMKMLIVHKFKVSFIPSSTS